MAATTLKHAFIGALATLLLQVSVAAPPDRRASHVLPSISINNSEQRFEEMSWAIKCYSLRTGAPRGCTILNHNLFGVTEAVAEGIVAGDCGIEADGSVTPGTCADGGHKHTSTPRPRTRIDDTGPPPNPQPRQPLSGQLPLTFDATDTDGDKFGVAGETPANQWVLIRYETPDNAGHFYWRGQLAPPPCFFLPQLCGFVGVGAQDDGTKIWDGTVEVSYRDLRQLPDMPTLYRKVRSPDSRHVDKDSFAGDQSALDAMRLIAQEYRTDTGKLLRPNDMSLPLGGLFDIVGTWQFSHETHRFGRDIDINRGPVEFLPGGGESVTDVRCEDDRDFIEAVNKVLVPERSVAVNVPVPGGGSQTQTYQTAVLCESLGRKHIDVTQLLILPTTP
ncbi:MAG TPA: hypothetical protein VLB07_02805 [Woeseiaceae bacterium]|nr:hypothetical protein [Woeseiaceae bacterium]